MHDRSIELMVPFPGVDRTTTSVKQRRILHALNDANHHIQARLACLQLAIPLFNRRIQKLTVCELLLARHARALDSSCTAVQRYRDSRLFRINRKC